MITVKHPGRPNDPWDWLRTVADEMLAAKDRRVPFMLDRAYKAFLGDGIDACFAVVRQYDVEITEGE